MGMKEWSTGRRRSLGVLATAVVLYLLYLAGTRLWAVFLEMHHM